VTEGSVCEEILNYIKLLTDKQRLDLLGEIYTDFKKDYQILTKTLEVTVISAYPLSEDEMERIKSKFKNQYNVLHVTIISEIDNSLLGGLKFIIGNKIIDRSIKGIMNEIKNQVIMR
jgi:F-type H+-transporting ATPase subunit delta